MDNNRVIQMLEYAQTFDGCNYGATKIAINEAIKAIHFNIRARELLSACVDLLNKQKDSYYVLNLLSELIFYDGSECDGLCLMEDIESLLEIEE